MEKTRRKQRSYNGLEFEVFKVASMKMAAFWDVAQCKSLRN
jgi:hypothetical protein